MLYTIRSLMLITSKRVEGRTSRSAAGDCRFETMMLILGAAWRVVCSLHYLDVSWPCCSELIDLLWARHHSYSSCARVSLLG